MNQPAAQWHSTRSSDSEMRLFVAQPADSGAGLPGVIVLQEAFGVNAHIRDVTSRIAALGYMVVAPELFHRTAPGFEGDYSDLAKSKPHMQALTNDNLEADLRAAQAWLTQQGKADANKLAAVGFCLGGKAAFIANAVLPLRAAASFYGSGIPALLGDYAARQQAPLMLIWGGDDKHIDAAQRASVADTLRAAKKNFSQTEFSTAGHGFFCDQRESYNPDAAGESWALLKAFLANQLPGNDNGSKTPR